MDHRIKCYQKWFDATFIVFVLLMHTWITTKVSACQPPDIPVGGYYAPISKQYDIGDRIQYDCFNGYLREGSAARMCKVDGKWTELTPFCDWPVKLKNPKGSSEITSVQLSIDNDTSTCFTSQKSTGQNFAVHLDQPAVIKTITMFLTKGYVRYDISSWCNGQKTDFRKLDRQLATDQWVVINSHSTLESDSILVQDIGDVSKSLAICEIEVYAKDAMWCDNTPNIIIPNGRLHVGRNVTTLECTEGFEPGNYKRLVCDKNSWDGGILLCKEKKSSKSNQQSLLIGAVSAAAVAVVICIILVVVVLLKKKQEPVVVVLKRDDIDAGTMFSDSSDYSTISYDNPRVLPNVVNQSSTLPSLPRHPSVDVVAQYSTPKDPPPYNMSPLYMEPEESVVNILGTLKRSPVYSSADT